MKTSFTLLLVAALLGTSLNLKAEDVTDQSTVVEDVKYLNRWADKFVDLANDMRGMTRDKGLVELGIGMDISAEANSYHIDCTTLAKELSIFATVEFNCGCGTNALPYVQRDIDELLNLNERLVKQVSSSISYFKTEALSTQASRFRANLREFKETLKTLQSKYGRPKEEPTPNLRIK
jgi:hypothetical protein